MRYRIRLCLLLIGVVSLSSCGWQFRGDITASLDIESIAIVGGRQDDAFFQRLSRALERSGIRLTSPEDADLTLKIENILNDRKPLTISPDGAVGEYQIYYVVVVSIQAASGEWLIRNQPIEVIRRYRFNRTQVLAKENEERRLYSDMRDNAVRRILQRLKVLKLPQKKVEKMSLPEPVSPEKPAESTADEN